ncbi:MAG: DNA methyltransferase [Planctomycetota bacterium]|nr:DNA methyltransferase [Planctomycetota bacterium]MEC8413808.1 DNA methyltransferase [Planctomycetota bacterium]MEE2660718.1 DNA methyltransferase [Planctomycetota bacterium]
MSTPTEPNRPGGYALPTGALQAQRRAKRELEQADIHLLGDIAKPHEPTNGRLKAAHSARNPNTRVYVGDCRDVLAKLPERGEVDLVFADPPFNWDVPYESWRDGMSRAEYERFTFDWLDGCIAALSPTGSLWVNIPDDTAAEIVLHLKRRGLTMINWCVWHFRFGQNRDSSFIMSKVHALYFAKDPDQRIWNPEHIMELSDRASVYADPRTMAKDQNKGLRLPMDVWYGKYWGRIQGNNKERRHQHHNQIPEVYLERVILACSNEGDLVLDPFLGSGGTCTVAKAWGRRSIGIEHSAVNAKSAWERIQNGMVRKGAAATPTGEASLNRRRRPD